MLLTIRHATDYHYAAPLVGDCHMELRLRPLTLNGVQTLHAYRVDVDPPADLHGYDLPSSLGHVDHFTLRGLPGRRLSMVTHSDVETFVRNPFDTLAVGVDDWAALVAADFHPRFAEWLSPSAAVPDAPGDWVGPERPTGGVLEYGQALMDHIHGSFAYVPGATDVATPLAEFVAGRQGVCQDYAHYMIALARREGIPARYVSGYVYSGLSNTLEGGDAMHAWVELYLPASGAWAGFDPMNNVLAADRHVKVAVGVDYNEVSPTRGVLRAERGYTVPALSSLTTSVTTTAAGVIDADA